MTHLSIRPGGGESLPPIVSGWTFGPFGLKPALGRLHTESDDLTPGAVPVVVLSHDYWTRRGIPNVIGHAGVQLKRSVVVEPVRERLRATFRRIDSGIPNDCLPGSCEVSIHPRKGNGTQPTVPQGHTFRTLFLPYRSG
jgi:hypothetical protein